MNTFENVSGYFHNSLNASITASKVNMIFAYFILTFAVILCKCNMCSYIILGLAVSELLMVDIYIKVLLMVLFVEDEALAAKVVRQSGKGVSDYSGWTI